MRGGSESSKRNGQFDKLEILLCLAPYPLPGILPRVTFSKCLRGLGLSGDLDRFGVSLGSSPLCARSLYSGNQGGRGADSGGGGCLELVFVLDAKEPERRVRKAGDGRALGSSGAGRLAVTLTRMPCSGHSISAFGHPLLAG